MRDVNKSIIMTKNKMGDKITRKFVPIAPKITVNLPPTKKALSIFKILIELKF